MSTRARADHVIWDNALPLYGEAPRTDVMLFRCLHCGDRFTLNLPCSLLMAGAVMRQYAREHRGCKQPKPTADTSRRVTEP